MCRMYRRNENLKKENPKIIRQTTATPTNTHSQKCYILYKYEHMIYFEFI